MGRGWGPNAVQERLPGLLPPLITPPRSVMGQQGMAQRGTGTGMAGLPGGVAGIAGLPQAGGMLGSFESPAGPLGALQDLFAPQEQQQSGVGFATGQPGIPAVTPMAPARRTPPGSLQDLFKEVFPGSKPGFYPMRTG